MVGIFFCPCPSTAKQGTFSTTSRETQLQLRSFVHGTEQQRHTCLRGRGKEEEEEEEAEAQKRVRGDSPNILDKSSLFSSFFN